MRTTVVEPLSPLIGEELCKVKTPHKDRIADFLAERHANGIAEGTLALDVTFLVDWAQALGDTDFTEATRAHVRAFVSSRGRSGKVLSDSRSNVRKITVRQFQRWVRGLSKKEPYPDEVAWLETVSLHDDGEEDELLDDLLTRPELALLINAHHHPQDRALLAALYDSGMRASEIASLEIRDVAIDEFGAVLKLRKKDAQGRRKKRLKTGGRHVRIIHATPYLVAWLNSHPLKHDENAPLFLSRSNRSFLGRLTGKSIHRMVVRMGERAKFPRPIWPHLFRHSRATEAAKEGWTEAEMRAFFGWSKKSQMPARYVHLAQKDNDDMVLRRAGLIGDKRENVGPALAFRKCLCGHNNPATADYCERAGCGRPLTVQASARAEDSLFERLARRLETRSSDDGNAELREGIERRRAHDAVAG